MPAGVVCGGRPSERGALATTNRVGANSRSLTAACYIAPLARSLENYFAVFVSHGQQLTVRVG